ncbi:MAG TPA: glycosyltransferase [Phycisphaerae bacterium]|nr:glycosyltransferase [Phycisphaerae bacterium]
MRILHVTHVVHPSAGGPPAVAIHLAAAQARLGHEVQILGHCPVGGLEQASAMIQQVPFPVSLPHRLLPLRKGIRALPNLPFRKAARTSLRETDILVAHGMWETSIIHSTLAAQRMGVPYCLRPAGTLDPWSLDQKRLKKSLSIALLHGRLLRDAAFIHATSDEEARNVRNLLRSLRISTPVHIIPNGIFLRDIENLPPRGDFYARHQELDGKPYILFLGRLHHKKRPDLLLQAFAALGEPFSEFRLVLAGPDAGQTARLRALAGQLGVAHRVHLTGPIYGHQRFSAFVDAACFCLPSHQENFGIAVVEAMASATPVVISDQVQIWPEIVEAGAGLACELSVDALAGALRRVLGAESARASMGRAGQAFARREYLWRDIGHRSTDIYMQYLPRTAAIDSCAALTVSP